MPDTPINMADGSYKRIDEVEPGDLVKVFNEESQSIEFAPVTDLNIAWHDNVHYLYLDSGKVLRPTANHPFLVRDKGWCTISGLDELNMGAGLLEVDDYVYQLTEDNILKWVKVTNIVPFEGNYLTYNFLIFLIEKEIYASIFYSKKYRFQ